MKKFKKTHIFLLIGSVFLFPFSISPAMALSDPAFNTVLEVAGTFSAESALYHWNFGDGHESSTNIPIVTHTYTSFQDYHASVEVSFVNGSGQASLKITPQRGCSDENINAVVTAGGFASGSSGIVFASGYIHIYENNIPECHANIAPVITLKNLNVGSSDTVTILVGSNQSVSYYATVFDADDVNVPLVAKVNNVEITNVIGATAGGNYDVVYTATDPHKASDSKTLHVHVVSENSAPVITLQHLDVGSVNTVTLIEGSPFKAMDYAIASDPDGDNVFLHASNSVDTSIAKTYHIDYTAEDEHGKPALPKTLTVIIKPCPNIICVTPDIFGDTEPESLGASFGSEKTLSQILTDNNYTIDVVNDQTNIQRWNLKTPGVTSISVDVKLLGKQSANSHVFGYYLNGDKNSFKSIFRAGTHSFYPLASEFQGTKITTTLNVDNTIGFAIDTEGGGTHYFVLSENALNLDAQDHVIVFHPTPNEYILAFEDLQSSVWDHDYNDIVVSVIVKSCEIPTPANKLPVAIIANITPARPNDTVAIDGKASYDPDGTISLYEWNFGDGLASTTPSSVASTTSRVYTADGTYTVTLKVTDNVGAVAYTTKTVVISTPTNPPANKLPVAIIANITPARPNDTVAIDGKASYDPDGTISLYEWNFGDGLASTTPSSVASTTSRVYTADGTYTVTLKVTDNVGAVAYTTKTVVISTPVVPPVVPPSCTGNCGGGGGGGGSGGGSVLVSSLIITNEKIEKGPIAGVSIISWTTNLPSDSRVVYGTSSVSYFPTGDEKYGYQKTTIAVSSLVTSHTMAIVGLEPNLTYYFRPLSKTPSLDAKGKELTLAPGECYYLREFIKYGANNNPIEVKKLQVFLNEFEGAKLSVTGFYDFATFNAVSVFQNKYKTEVLSPWGETTTGYVYLTTRKQVNEIYCKAAFPLDGAQTSEVDAFRVLMESLRTQGVVIPAEESLQKNNSPLTGLVNGFGTGTDNLTPVISGGDFKQTLATETKAFVSASPVTNRGIFRNMIGATYGAVSGAITSYWLAIILLALLVPTGFYAKKMLEDEEVSEKEEATTEKEK